PISTSYYALNCRFRKSHESPGTETLVTAAGQDGHSGTEISRGTNRPGGTAGPPGRGSGKSRKGRNRILRCKKKARRIRFACGGEEPSGPLVRPVATTCSSEAGDVTHSMPSRPDAFPGACHTLGRCGREQAAAGTCDPARVPRRPVPVPCSPTRGS